MSSPPTCLPRRRRAVKSVTSEAAEALRGRDPDFLARDLLTALGGPGGVGSASWTMYVQAVPEADAPGYHVDIFDVTKVIPHGCVRQR
jgi:catalase